MKRILLEGPAVEPVLLPEMKAHLRLDGAAEDDLLDGLITAARVAVETEIRRVLIAQRWRAVFDDWLWDELVLPVAPSRSVEAVRVIDRDGAATTIAADDVEFEATDGSVRVSGPRPPRAERVQIDFTAGYGASGAQVPQPLRQALRLLVTHWYEHRSAASMGEAVAAMPLGYCELVAPYRRLSIC